MPSENYQRAQAFIEEVEKERNQDSEERERFIREFFGGKREGKSPRPFENSSFLFSRSYPSDIGMRPFSGINFWCSPDINIVPLSNTSSPTTDLKAGETYFLRCVVRNNGDVIVPSAKVEFYLVDPSLGFNTLYAEKIGVCEAWINPYSSDEVALKYTVPADQSGHKCLFARVFSFSPPDYPEDVYALDPTTDRHTAQKNLNIVSLEETTSFPFQVILSELEPFIIQFKPMDTLEVVQHLQWNASDFRPLDFSKHVHSLQMYSREENLEINQERAGYRIDFKPTRIRIPNRRGRIFGRFERLKSLKKSRFEQFERYTTSNKLKFTLDLSQLPYEKGIAGGFHIVAQSLKSEKIIGGISLIII